MSAHFILYVTDQAASTAFYRSVLQIEPRLDVPGMTEFEVGSGAVLGLMPQVGIKQLLGASLPDPTAANGVPRCELYLVVERPLEYHDRALAAGAKALSPVTLRDWGDEAGYSLDPDGHVLAFASARR